MRKIDQKYLFIMCLVLLLAGMMGCSSRISDETNGAAEGGVNKQVQDGFSTNYPLSVSNHSIDDGVWSEKDQVFKAAPQRVVANNQSIAELLIRLGLTKSMVGVAALYGETAEDIYNEFQTIPVLSSEYVGKELTLGAAPDLVIGRADLFADSEWGVGTVKELNSLGINTYILNTGKKGATISALFQDIKEIGTIFNVQENAAAFAADLQSRLDKLSEKVSEEQETLRYAYVSVTDGNLAVYSASNDTFQNSVLNIIKLDNAFKDAAGNSEINLEQFVSANPDVLLISHYNGGQDPMKSIEQIYNMPALQSISAVKNQRIFIIDFSRFWGYSYQIIDGAEQLSKELYPNLKD